MRNILLLASLVLPIAARAQAGPNGQWIAFSRAGAPDSRLQCFTPKNVTVSDGDLVITTNSESATCRSFDLSSATHNYTSGFVSMRSFKFLYGTLEFRAKFGGGMKTGAWPVVWMADASCQASDPTGTDDRCNGQEIDVAEILNGDFSHVNQQIHVNSFAHNDGCTAPAADTSQNFHVYQLVWFPSSLVFNIDGDTTCRITKDYVPNAAMYVKISMYVGGYGGSVKRTSLPWTTLIDYVRITQGATVLFNDDFDSSATVQPAQAAEATSPSSYDLSRISILNIPPRSLAVLAVCLAMAAVTSGLTFYRLRRKTTK